MKNRSWRESHLQSDLGWDLADAASFKRFCCSSSSRAPPLQNQAKLLLSHKRLRSQTSRWEESAAVRPPATTDAFIWTEPGNLRRILEPHPGHDSATHRTGRETSVWKVKVPDGVWRQFRVKWRGFSSPGASYPTAGTLPPDCVSPVGRSRSPCFQRMLNAVFPPTLCRRHNSDIKLQKFTISEDILTLTFKTQSKFIEKMIKMGFFILTFL